METIYLETNEYKALKLHWSGSHGLMPAKIAKKCDITVKRYHEIVGLSQEKDIIIKERV